MNPPQHLFWSLIPISFFIAVGVNLPFISMFIIGAVLLDIDHFIGAFMINRETDIMKIYGGYLNYEYTRAIIPFHTVEFALITFITGLFNPFFIPLFIGLGFHMTLDIIECFQKGKRRICFLYLMVLNYRGELWNQLNKNEW